MEFSASHRLWRDDWNESRNREVFGHRASALSHGHNYELEVTVRGEVDPQTGMVIDLALLRDVMEAEVASQFDHRDLNDDTAWFGSSPPTAENFARLIFDLLDGALPPGLLARVCLRPTPAYAVELVR